jgi:hypothetical protein
MKKIIIVALLSVVVIVPMTFALPAVEGQDEIFPCTKENAYQVIEESDFSLLICSFGSPPEKKTGGWWSANGLAFHKLSAVKGKAREEFLFQVEEYRNAVDYQYKDNTLSIITYTENTLGFKLKPFMKEVIALSGPDTKRSYTALLKTGKYTKDDIEKAISFLKTSTPGQVNEYQGTSPLAKALFKLRDYALQDPGFIEKELRNFRSRWWCDGEMAETLSEIEDEVKILKKVKSASERF